MFYSHTFLGRKGPLGIVWCAVHQEYILKKSHYTFTDIPSTVERIMYPDVPLALRMSSHLLLGVVRIYSKKVEYAYQHCNDILISITKTFVSVGVNLPENANYAPFHAVTLPDTFELDAVDLGDDFSYTQIFGNHLRSQEEITITDQIPVGRDPYITITLDQGILRDFSRAENASGSGARPMEEDNHPSAPVGTTVGPSNLTGVYQRFNEDRSPQNVPEIEVTRDFHVDNIPVWPDLRNDVIEPDITLEQQVMNEKAILAPAMEETLVSRGRSIPSQQHGEPHTSAASDRNPAFFDSNVSFGHVSPDLELCATPPVGQPKARRPRKRKQLHDDKETVLTNKFMKAMIDNCSDLLRKRKCCPYSGFDVWKSNNRLRKEKVFLEPLLAGLCADLRNTYSGDYIYSKPHLVSLEEPRQEPSVVQSPPPHPTSDLAMEIENPRNYEGPGGSNILSEIIHSPIRFMPSPTRFMPSTYRRKDYSSNLGSQSEPLLGTTVAPGVQSTPELGASIRTVGSEIETPMTFSREGWGLENTGLSDIPEVMDSAEADELNFLASEDYTPPRFRRTKGVDSLSGTTRVVAEYLKGKWSVTPSSEELSGDLILNKILEGKRRNVCARMVSETLVLKCYGLVDVIQEEPYGDIILKLTPKLFKDQV